MKIIIAGQRLLRGPCAAIALFLMTMTGPLLADTGGNAVASGLDIAMEADRRDKGFGDTTADLTMLLFTREGEQVRRTMRQQVLEVADDGDKSILVFDRPRDLKGTAILTFTRKVGTDDQWLYLPALDRVKRISSSDKSGPFMGSEFAYEDLASHEIEKFNYRYLGDEDLGLPAFKVERIPVDPKSGYSRQVAWYDKEHYRVLRIDYYDRKDTLLKTMELTDYQLYLEQYWRPDILLMTNHQTGKRTAMQFSNFRFRTGLGERDFSREALARSR